MPTLTRYRRSNVQVPELARSDVKLKDMKLSELELPKFDLSKVDLPKVEIPKFERPTPDEVGKAVAGVATAVGLAKARPRRWPYLVVAGLAVAAAGWIAMNWSTIRARIDAVAARAKERMTAVQGDETWDDAVAFTAADTKAIEPSIDPPSIDAVSISSPTLDDYPDGLGIAGEPVGASRS